MSLEACIGGNEASKSSRNQKTWTIAHQNGQKCLKSKVLTMPLESCTGGHGAPKPPQDPKNMDYGPRKRLEIPEITSFDDAARFVYRGSRGTEILPGSEKRRPEMPEITSFDDVARVVYRGSQGIESLPGPKNRGL